MSLKMAVLNTGPESKSMRIVPTTLGARNRSSYYDNFVTTVWPVIPLPSSLSDLVGD